MKITSGRKEILKLGTQLRVESIPMVSVDVLVALILNPVDTRTVHSDCSLNLELLDKASGCRTALRALERLVFS